MKKNCGDMPSATFRNCRSLIKQSRQNLNEEEFDRR